MDMTYEEPIQKRVINYLAGQNESSSGLKSMLRDLGVDSYILRQTLLEMDAEGMVQFSGAWTEGGHVRLIEDSV